MYAHLLTATVLSGQSVVAGAVILVAILNHFGLDEIEVSERDILDGIALAAAELPAPEEGAAPPGACAASARASRRGTPPR